MGLSGRVLILALSAALLGVALHVNDGLYSSFAIVLMGSSLLLCIAGVTIPIPERLNLPEGQARIVMALLAGAMMVAMYFKTAGASEATVPAVDQFPYRVGITIALAAVVLIALGRRRLGAIGFAILLGAHLAIGVWKIRAAPAPKIDVWHFQTDSPAALARGINPYTITFPNIYGPDTYVYGPGVVREGRLMFGFPYPPLVLCSITPSQLLLGDFRYTYLAAMLVGAVLIASMRRDPIGMLAAAMLLFTPRFFYVLESGWTEPLSVMLLAATVVCSKRFPKLAAVMLGLLIASKQYLPAAILLVPLLASPQHGRDARVTLWLLIGSIVVALLVTAPLALWDVRAFVYSTLTLQFHQPYRPDALSLLAWWGSNKPGWVGPFWLCFLALIVAVVLSLWRARTFAAAFALCFFVFFAFNKQAFANYYYLVIGALCCAVACEKPHANDVSSR
jgi:hypothetical protein